MNKPHQAEALCDVAIVGYGPIGQIMALALSRQGHRVSVIERWTERYSLPRAVCIDHEIYRVLSGLGMRDTLPRVTHAAPVYRWFSSDWQELLAIDWSAESLSGGPQVNFVHQPTLEELFDEQVRAENRVDLNLGWEVVDVTQTDEYAMLQIKHCDSGNTREIKARYIVGADGANSIVRRTIGGGLEDRGFEADWLVVDILPNEGANLDIPPAAQWCNPERPTTIVPAGVRNGRYYRRWEFMRLPHETIEDIESDEKAWVLMSPWVKPKQATLVRHKVYRFQSILAEKWRDGRLLIAGDAAHVMPPFMGQGMCTGLRDAWNLAWKLDLILDGKANSELLDSYQEERRPHASDVIDMSMYLGNMICQPDVNKAVERDKAFLEGKAPPMPAFPSLRRGILLDDREGESGSVEGLLSPHGKVDCRGSEGWFDEFIEPGQFVLVVKQAATVEHLDDQAHQVIEHFNLPVVAFSGEHPVITHYIDDQKGEYRKYFENHNLAAILIRPDFYIFGGSHEITEVSRLVAALSDMLPASVEKEAMYGRANVL